MRSRTCGWPLTLAVLLMACESRELSRADAARQLADHLAAAPVPAVRIYRATCVDKYFARFPFAFRKQAQIASQYDALAATRLVRRFEIPATADRCGTPYPESLRIIGIALTDTGVAAQWPEHQDGEGGWDIPVGRRAVMDVTNIVPQADPDVVQVEYRWRLILTQAGIALEQRGGPYESRALFRRDETGWHISPN